MVANRPRVGSEHRVGISACSLILLGYQYSVRQVPVVILPSSTLVGNGCRSTTRTYSPNGETQEYREGHVTGIQGHKISSNYQTKRNVSLKICAFKVLKPVNQFKKRTSFFISILKYDPLEQG